MASRSLGTLTLDLVAKIGGFVAGMDKAARESEKRMAQIQKNAKAVGVALAAAGAAAGAFAVAQVKAAIDSADALSKQSKAVGIAVEDLSALNYAAELSDVSVEQLSGSLNKFNRTIDDASDGTGAGAEAFDALGVSIKNADGTLKSNLDLVKEIADAFQEMPDGIQKSALAQDLFGKSGAKLIPLLNDGSEGLAMMADEAERLGLIIDGDTAAAAEQFNDNLTRLSKSADALGIALAEDFLPPLTRITNEMVEAQRESGLLSALWAGLAQSFKEVAGADLRELDQFEKKLERLRDSRSRFVANRDLSLGGISDDYLDDQIRRTEFAIDRLKRAREESKADIGGGGLESPSEEFTKREAALRKESQLYGEVTKAAQLRYEIESGLIEGLSEAEGQKLIALQQELDAREQATKFIEEQAKSVEQLQSAYDGQLEAYVRQIALTGEITELERVRYEITSGNLVGINAEQQRRLEGLAAEVDAQEELRRAEESRKELQEQVNSITSGLMTEQEAALERYIEDMNALNQAQREGITILGGYDDASRRVFEQYQEEVKKANEATEEMSVYAEQAARNMQDAFADFLFDPFSDGLDGMLENFGRILQRMAAEMAAAAIFDSFKNMGNSSGGSASSGTSGNGTDWLGLVSSFAGFFDTGGMIGAGQFGIVGEKGPEIVSGPAMITSRNDTARMMGGSSIVIESMSFPGVRTEREVQQASGAAARQLSRVANSGQRYS